MASITSSGIGSGIDINNLVSQLVAAERKPVTDRLDLREGDLQAEVSAFGVVKGALSDLQDTLSGLTLAGFQGRSAASAEETVFTATATSGAVPSSSDIEVVRLAEAQKLISGEFTAADTEVGTGTLTISTAGTSFSVTIDASSKTLSGVRDAINGAAGNPGVSASIINVDDASGTATVSKLVLTAGATGTANTLSVAVSDDDGDSTDSAGLSQLLFDPAGIQNLTESQPAVDAEIRFDGQTVTSSSNTVSGVIEGVTLTLLQADPGNTHALSVAQDEDGARNAIEDLVQSYNVVVDTANQLASFDPATGQAGILLGDSTLRAVTSQLQRVLNEQFAGLPDGVDSLAALGITTGADGKLVIGTPLQGSGDQQLFNTGTLDAALSDHFDDVAQLFAGEDGLVSRLDGLVGGLLASDGSIQARSDGLDARISRIGENRVALDRRMEALQQRLFSQFQAMDALVANLKTTSDFLSQQLTSIQNISTGNNRNN